MTHHKLSDDDLRAAFLARAGGPPSPELADRIRVATDATRQSRGFGIIPGLAAGNASRLGWAAVVAALGVALVGVLAFGAGRFAMTPPDGSPSPSVVASAAPSAVPSVGPTESMDPTVQPSAEPSASPEPSPSAGPSQAPGDTPVIPADLGPDRIGHVVATDGLRVRSQPTVAEASELREPTLDEGVTFYVVAGPVLADGYAWYQVDPYGGDPALPFGWVAGGSRDGEPWIENLFDGCDSIYPSLEMIASSEPQESLYCYGSGHTGEPIELELTGDLYCDVGDVEGLAAGPAWVEFDRFCELRAPGWTVEDGVSLRVWGPAATGLLEQGQPVQGRYTVFGHFDDPGASECRSGDFEGAPDPEEVVLGCRMAFVATEVAPAD